MPPCLLSLPLLVVTRSPLVACGSSDWNASVERTRRSPSSVPPRASPSRPSTWGSGSSRARPRRPPAKRRHDHGRSPLPAHLERRDTVLDLTPEERRCPDCGTDRVCIGRTQIEHLDYDPTTYFVRRTVRKTYDCHRCPPMVPPEERIRPPPRAPSGRSTRGCAVRGCNATVHMDPSLTDENSSCPRVTEARRLNH